MLPWLRGTQDAGVLVGMAILAMAMRDMEMPCTTPDTTYRDTAPCMLRIMRDG